MKIIITKPDLFAAALKFMSTDDLRRGIKGVCLQPRPEGGCYLVATDGHSFFAGVDVEAAGVDKEYIIRPLSKPWLASLAKAMALEISDTLITPYRAGGNHAPMPFKIVDDTFPDWRRFVPDCSSGVVSDFNAEYVATFGAASKLLECETMKIFHNGCAPCLVKGQRDDWFGILMPLRVNPYEIPVTFGYPGAFNIPAPVKKVEA